jgi:xylulokinase
MGSMGGMGAALEWWKNIAGVSYTELDAGSAGRMDSASDILVRPYMSGAGIINKLNEKSLVEGMTLRHDKYDIARAIMEGVVFELRLMLEEFASSGMKAESLTMTGGAAKSKPWLEITGYATDCDIYLAEESESSCLGAAMMAAVGMGLYPDLPSCASEYVKRRRIELPDIGVKEFYEDKFNRYRNKMKN